jgi:hypothetical protein
MKSILTKNQKKYFEKSFKEDGCNKIIKVTIRFDDECGNGQNSFSITGEILNLSLRSRDKTESCGCIHEEIEKHFPEFKKFIPFHLMSADEGPMHYVANALYFASDKDCWGYRKNEPKDFKEQLFFNDVPVPVKDYGVSFLEFTKNANLKNIIIEEYVHEKDAKTFGSKFTFKGLYQRDRKDWYGCPFRDLTEAQQMKLALETCKRSYETICVGYGEGKKIELDKARLAAVWPEATLEDFTKEKLEARLPMLLKNLKQAVESLGMVY